MSEDVIKVKRIDPKNRMIYWKMEDFWQGKLIEYPEVMMQGITIKELEFNLKNAHSMMG